MLKVEKLTKYYDKVLGCKNITFEVNSGEIFGFIGPNGAGKSTTIRCIMNLLNKTNGEVYINKKLFTKDRVDLLENIGYLPSEIHLYDNMTIKELFEYNNSFYKKDYSDRAKMLVSKLKIDVNKKVSDLSLGNSKKVGIVLAMMHEPKLLIMDEATNGLDPLIQENFYELLLDEKKNGTTILYSSHNLSEVKKICDRVGIIKEGILIKVDNIDNICDSNTLLISIYSSDKSIEKKYGNINSKKNDCIKFMYSGDINKLISELSNYKINKLLIEEPSLEDIFIEYYR